MEMMLIGLLAFWVQGGVFAAHAVGDRLFEQSKFKQALCCYHWYYSICRFIPHSRGRAALRLCACYFYMAQYPQARRYAEDALQVAATQEQEYDVIYAQAYLAILLAVESRYEEAEALFEEVLEVSCLDDILQAQVQYYAAVVYMKRRRLEEAERLLRATLEQTTLTGDYYVAVECALSVCLYFQERGDEALVILRRLAQELSGRVEMQANVLSGYLVCLVESGDMQGAQEVESRLMPYLPRLAASPLMQGRVYCALGRSALRKGELDQARDYAERAYPLEDDPDHQASALTVQAEVFAARHNLHRARQLCEEILRLNTIDFHRRRTERLLREWEESGTE